MRIFLLVGILILSACQNSNIDTTFTADMYNADGDMVGTAVLNEQEDGVQFEVQLEGLSPGFHAIHVHENAVCEGPDFKSAGNHLNPEGTEHGLMHPEGPHLGDLPNLEADSDGLVDAELMLPEATLTDGKNSLLDSGGTSLVVQEGQNDGVTQPGGDAKERIYCGEIIQEKDQKTQEETTDPTQFNKEQEE